MAECSDLQGLEKITSEVDDSHVKIILSSQCIKAQKFLVDRLRKESVRHKEVCKYLSGGNMKLEAEIKHAEQEFKSLLTAKDTIRTSNIEIRKELLLAKERKIETIERVENGIEKYEELWEQCKKRSECIPRIQKFSELTSKNQSTKDKIKYLEQEIETVTHEIETTRRVLKELDQKRVIEIAYYLMRERPVIMQDVTSIMEKWTELNKKIADFKKKEEEIRNELEMKLLDGDWPSLDHNFSIQQDTLKMPNRQTDEGDQDILAVNLEQSNKTGTSPKKIPLHSDNSLRSPKTEETTDDYYISAYFNKSYLTTGETEINISMESAPENYAKKKLINILEDIDIDQKDAKDLVSSANPSAMKVVNMIGGNALKSNDDTETDQNKQLHCEGDMEDEQIEEIDLTASNNILIPPTQFLDLTQEKTTQECEELKKEEVVLSQEKNSQDRKKKVTFDLPVIEELPENKADVDKPPNNELDLPITGQVEMDTSGMSKESFTKMKDRILKKYSSDLSPDFVYEKKTPEEAITSKFFNNKTSPKSPNNKDETTVEKPEITDQDNEQEPPNKKERSTNDQEDVVDPPMMVDTEIVNTCSKNKENQDKSVSGFLFTHGPHGIPDSLDLSISTGFDEGDLDFPHCIDPTLLLSPKADMLVANSGDNVGPFSQEVPNFLSGLRKTGLSFFSRPSGSDSKKESNENVQEHHFNFKFGGDEKKSRGGLFSMFR